MISENQLKRHFSEMFGKLRNARSRKPVLLTKEWVNNFPKEAGVYLAFEDNRLVYIGETGKLTERMRDLLDSRHHSIRRNIGRLHFASLPGYRNATSKTKFPGRIEDKVVRFIKHHIKISFLPTRIGRKEFEEWIIKERSPIYNKKGQRGVE